MKQVIRFLSGFLAMFITTLLFAQPQYYNYNTPNATNNAFPFNSNPSTGKTIQSLYLPGAFTGAPSGNITKIYFQASSSGSATYTRLTIKMGSTTDIDLPANAWYATNMTTVFDSTNFPLAGSIGQFSSITLQTPFLYDSTKSLVVEITQCGYSGLGIGVYYTILSGTKRSAGPLAVTVCPHPWGNQNGYSTHTGIDVNTIVGIQPISGNIPFNYSLGQNYPNPFNPETDIRFNIKEAGQVSLVVYDMLGKVVRELINEQLNAGEYSYKFNASNLTSGVYLYRLSVNGYSETKKLMLIK